MTTASGSDGERFLPDVMGGDLIEAEHRARYLLGAQHAAGLRVLDAGCGVGWGSALLRDMGAASVDGVDIAPDAIAAAAERYPQARFTVGDLLDLPYADQSFDVVVCFEALEHTKDTGRALDELRRVVTADGVVLVSSPNPAVYPAGNPFHLHELAPDELRAAVAGRFAHVALYRQHLLIASTILPDGAGAADLHGIVPQLVSPLATGFDPYSVAVASDRGLADVPGVQSLAMSHQLVNLGAAAGAIEEERAEIRADHQRIIAERSALLDSIADERAAWRAGDVRIAAEREELLEAHRAAGADRDEAMHTRNLAVMDRDAARAELAAAAAAHAETLSQLADHQAALLAEQSERARLEQDRARLESARASLEGDRDALTQQVADQAGQIAHARQRLAQTERQRDRLGSLLVSGEQQLAAAVNRLQPERERAARLEGAVAGAQADLVVLAEAAAELGRVRATRSWRSTRPLRFVRSKFPVRDEP